MYLNSSMVQIPDVECFKSRKYLEAKNIAKYFGKEVRCVLCESQRQSELSVMNTDSTCAEMPVSTSQRLYKLGYVQPPENIQVPLSKRTENVETKILMRFIECINLEGRGPSVVEFDVEVFQSVLRFAARDDHLVNNWISMVLSDKAEYKEGASFFALLLLVYDFLKRHNLPQLRKLKEKIISSERFFKPHRVCDISWQDDAEIDKFVIQMIKPRVD